MTTYPDLRSIIRELKGGSEEEKKTGELLDTLLFCRDCEGHDFDEAEAEQAVTDGYKRIREIEIAAQDSVALAHGLLELEVLVQDVRERIDCFNDSSYEATQEFLNSWIEKGGY